MAGQIIEIFIERQPLYAWQHLPWTQTSFLASAAQTGQNVLSFGPLSRSLSDSTITSASYGWNALTMTWSLLTESKQIHSCQTPTSYILTHWDKTENGPFHIQHSNSFLCVSARLSARWLQPTDRCLEYCGLPALTFSHCARCGGGQ